MAVKVLSYGIIVVNFKQFLGMCSLNLLLSISGYCEPAVPKTIHHLSTYKKTFRSHFAQLHFKKAYNFNEVVKVYGDKIDPVITSEQSRIDTHFLSIKTLRRAFNRMNELNIHQGAHLDHGGLRVSNFIDSETLIYVKAQFIHHKENNTPLHSEFFKSLATTETQTTFNPSIGFEWKLPDNLSIAGELSNDFGQASPLLQGSNQIHQSVLFNIRYQFDTRPRTND